MTAALAAGCTGSGSSTAPTVTPPPLVFTADGGPPVGASPVQVSELLRRAWAATTAAHTAVVTTTSRTRLTTAGQAQPQLFGVTGTGPADLDRAAVDLDLAFPRHVTQRWRFIGDALYSPEFLTTGTRPVATSWDRLDLADPAGYTGTDAVPANPVSLLRDLSMSLTSAAASATTRLDGVPVTRYDATAQLPAAITAATTPGARLALRYLEHHVPADHVYVQAWIDGQGRIRQLMYTDQTTVATPTADANAAPDPGELATTSTTLTLTRFGVTAHVTAPATPTPR